MRRSTRNKLQLLALSAVATSGLAVFLACSSCSNEVLKAPTSDQTFDDPDDPGSSGTIGAADATTGEAGLSCSATAPCPTTFTCFYAVSAGCSSGVTGRCFAFTPPAQCVTSPICNCTGQSQDVCAPAGFSPVPVRTIGSCEDATLDAASGG